MAFCGFAKGAAMYDSTPIENMFLTEFLPAAPEQFLKVYLYARMLALHPELDAALADLASALRMDEDAVLDAMAYWEQQGLARRLSDRPPAYELLPVQGGASGMDRAYYEYRDFNADLQALFPENLLHPAEFSRAVDWINVMGFSQDAVLLAVRHEIGQSRSKSPRPGPLFKRLDRKMLAWADRGAKTRAALERELSYSDAVRDTAARVVSRLGMKRPPSDDELAAVRRWLEEWRFTPEAVLDACAETTKARTPTVAYLDAVLKSRHSGDADLREELVAALKELDGGAAQPTPDELAKYARFRQLGFEADTVRLAAVQCHRKRKTRFEDLEWMLEEWQKLGLYTRQAAEAYVRDMGLRRERMRAVMKRCGLERATRMDDLDYLEAWRAKLPDAVIDYAADCARGMHRPLLYMDRLIAEWAGEGVRTVEDARIRHEAHVAAAKATGGGKASGGGKANPALDYAQRDYSAQDEDSFFIDLEKEYGDGGDGA